MDGYKIGEISSIFGISADAIRYYESRGIITPKRDENSGYRYYDSWAINYLLDCIWYRSYDLAISDIEQMIKTDNCEEVIQKLQIREQELLDHIEEQKLILKQVSNMKRKLTDMKTRLGQFDIVKSPELIWQPQRTKIQSEEGVLANGEEADTVRKWVDHMLFLNHTFVMPSKTKKHTFGEYSWGFSLSPAKFKELGLKMADSTVYMPSYTSIYSVFVAGEADTFLSCIHEQVIDPIREKGYQITKPPFGNLLVRVHENGKMKRYVETWVPIEA